MKRSKYPKQRYQLILMAAGMAVLGAVLLFLSAKVKPAPQPAAKAPATATAPTTAPATAPAQPPSGNRATLAARNMSGMLLLFGLVALGVSATCVGLLIVDIRRSRPAWMTQQRYPRRR